MFDTAHLHQDLRLEAGHGVPGLDRGRATSQRHTAPAGEYDIELVNASNVMCCLPPRTQVRSYQCFFFGVFLASTEKSTERNELRNFYHFKICELSITLLNNNEVTKFVSCMCCVTPCSTNQPDTSLAWTRLT